MKLGTIEKNLNTTQMGSFLSPPSLLLQLKFTHLKNVLHETQSYRNVARGSLIKSFIK